MTQMSNLERVHKVLKYQLDLDPEQIDMETTLDAMGADSLDRLEMVMFVEEEFEIEIEDEIAEKLKTPQQVLDYIESLVP